MERQTAEIQDKMNALHDEQSQLERDLEESQSERNTKYRELRKREETMDQFLTSFEANKEQELERCSGLEREIEGVTSNLASLLTNSEQLPNRQDFLTMKDDLAFR